LLAAVSSWQHGSCADRGSSARPVFATAWRRCAGENLPRLAIPKWGRLPACPPRFGSSVPGGINNTTKIKVSIAHLLTHAIKERSYRSLCNETQKLAQDSRKFLSTAQHSPRCACRPTSKADRNEEKRTPTRGRESGTRRLAAANVDQPDRYGVVDFWTEVYRLNANNERRRQLLQELIDWRNAIAHQDFDPVAPGGTPTLHLARVRAWRRAVNALAGHFDQAMYNYLTNLNNHAPW
jgi:hypothetical protein